MEMEELVKTLIDQQKQQQTQMMLLMHIWFLLKNQRTTLEIPLQDASKTWLIQCYSLSIFQMTMRFSSFSMRDTSPSFQLKLMISQIQQKFDCYSRNLATQIINDKQIPFCQKNHTKKHLTLQLRSSRNYLVIAKQSLACATNASIFLKETLKTTVSTLLDSTNTQNNLKPHSAARMISECYFLSVDSKVHKNREFLKSFLPELINNMFNLKHSPIKLISISSRNFSSTT